MLHTKNGNDWPGSFQEEVKNVKLLTHDAQTHDDGRRPIAIGHLSDSGDLKIIHRGLRTHESQ